MSTQDAAAGSMGDTGALAGVMGGGGSTAQVDPDMAALSADDASAAGNGGMFGMNSKGQSGLAQQNIKLLAAQLAKIGQTNSTATPGLQQTQGRPMYAAGGGTINTTGGR